ncbi:MAG: hypothetical protein HY317_01730 [Acidobacteria bacterium]|nr:hypothetical protein [Acidobacteriota bacterium]
MRATRMALGAFAVALLAGPAVAGTFDDDLAVVKKALTPQGAPSPEPAAQVTPTGPREERRVARRGEKPTWLKVRVVEKGDKRARVSVNVPLALARALGDGFPIDLRCRRHARDHHAVRLGEVLDALESGQELVEIEDEDTTVKVWVE